MNALGSIGTWTDRAGATAVRDVEVAIVGGGPAGAALAARLGDAGHEVVLLERRAEPKWRASGVFTSPATVTEMHDLALDASEVRRLVRPVPELRVDTVGGRGFTLSYSEHGGAAGLDRVAVERVLLDHAAAHGAEVRRGEVVTSVELPGRRSGDRASITASGPDGSTRYRAAVLVGDAAGYVDPLSGEGIHRAFVSARMAASAIGAKLAGDTGALDTYSERLRERFARKDLVSWLLQMFTSRPAMTDYVVERLARRGELRRTFLLVMADLAPVERALRPRFLASLFAP